MDLSVGDFLFFVAASVGMTSIIVDGAIFNKPRKKLKEIFPSGMHKLIDCHQCCGFWVGMFCSILYFRPHNMSDWLWSWFQPNEYAIMFLCGCCTSLMTEGVVTYYNYLEAQSILHISEDDFGEDEEDGDKPEDDDMPEDSIVNEEDTIDESE